MILFPLTGNYPIDRKSFMSRKNSLEENYSFVRKSLYLPRKHLIWQKSFPLSRTHIISFQKTSNTCSGTFFLCNSLAKFLHFVYWTRNAWFLVNISLRTMDFVETEAFTFTFNKTFKLFKIIQQFMFMALQINCLWIRDIKYELHVCKDIKRISCFLLPA